MSYTIITAKFTPGKYWIGDLCYVMHTEWDEICGITIDHTGCKEGIFKLDDGRDFGTWGTAYGDGEYRDNAGRKYCVDSGSIGIIAFNDINKAEYGNLNLGNVIEFSESFIVQASKGEFRFGDIYIDTRDEDQDELYEDEYD